MIPEVKYYVIDKLKSLYHLISFLQPTVVESSHQQKISLKIGRNAWMTQNCELLN